MVKDLLNLIWEWIGIGVALIGIALMAVGAFLLMIALMVFSAILENLPLIIVVAFLYFLWITL